jgi:hypothetical protein
MADSKMVGNVKVEKLADGRVRLTHPTGVVRVEDPVKQRAALAAAADGAVQAVVAFDKWAGEVAALAPAAK